MELDTFLLLLGFTLVKIGVAGAIIWVGFRTGEAPGEDGPFGEPEPEPLAPVPPPPRRRSHRPRRRAERSPARTGRSARRVRRPTRV